MSLSMCVEICDKQEECELLRQSNSISTNSFTGWPWWVCRLAKNNNADNTDLIEELGEVKKVKGLD